MGYAIIALCILTNVNSSPFLSPSPPKKLPGHMLADTQWRKPSGDREGQPSAYYLQVSPPVCSYTGVLRPDLSPFI